MNTMPKPADFANATAIRRADILDLEEDLSDIAQMARIAESIVCELIMDTEFKYSGEDQEVFEVVGHTLTPDGVSRAMFAVSHVREMMEALRKKHGL